MLIERQALRRASHDDAVNRGLVKAFREHGAVSHDARRPSVQPLEDGPAGRERCRPIQGLGGDAGRPEGLRHGIGQSDGGGKQQRLAVRRMGLKGGEDLRWGIGGEEQALQLGLDKIPVRGPQRIKVGLEQHLEGAQVDEIACLHHLHQGFLVDDAVKDLP